MDHMHISRTEHSFSEQSSLKLKNDAPKVPNQFNKENRERTEGCSKWIVRI